MSADVWKFASKILRELCLEKLFLLFPPKKEVKSFAESEEKCS